MVDIRQTPEYAHYLSCVGWIVERKDNVNYFIKKIPLIGSLIKIQRPEKTDLHNIAKLAKKYRAFQIVLEPNLTVSVTHIHDRLLHKGYKLSKSPYLPTKTMLLDLKLSEKKLLTNLKKDARYAIKKNEKLELRRYSLEEIEEFRQVWKSAVNFKRYISPINQLSALKKTFAENCLLITDNQKRGGAIFLKTKDIAYYWQAFTDKKGRKAQIQYKIIWDGILWAKKSGCKIFDFEGIFDERFPNKSWLGFTHFKKSFGGKEVEYPGCFVKKLPLICK